MGHRQTPKRNIFLHFCSESFFPLIPGTMTTLQLSVKDGKDGSKEGEEEDDEVKEAEKNTFTAFFDKVLEPIFTQCYICSAFQLMRNNYSSIFNIRLLSQILDNLEILILVEKQGNPLIVHVLTTLFEMFCFVDVKQLCIQCQLSVSIF